MVSLGQYSGTKKGQMENDIANDTLRQVGDTSANLVNSTYGANLEAMLKGQALAPSVMQTGLMPGQVTSAVGDTQHNMEQAQTSEQYNQKQMSDMWNLLLGQELMGTSMMIPGGTNQSTATTPGPSTGQQIFGGISSLLPLFAML